MRFPLRALIPAVPLITGLAFAAVTPEPPAPAVLTAPPLPGDPAAEEWTRARKVLEMWETTDPQKEARRMRVVYWTPADREPQPDYRARLTRVMLHVEGFYRAQMAAYGFADRSIRLDMAPDGMLQLPVAKGTLKSAECSEDDGSDGQAIRRDCLAALKAEGIDGEKETLVIFCNLADFDPDQRTMSHHSPYYAAGDSRSGTAWQLDSPLLDPLHFPVKDQFLTDAQYGRISLGKYNSIFIGGVCHEIGHALGLPHCRECAEARPLRGTALMGSGNRTYGEELRGESKGTFLTAAHALKLAAHPQFSGSVKRMGEPAEVAFSQWSMSPSPEGLKVSGQLVSALPAHAVLAYGDPAGGGDYDAVIAAAVPRPDGRFSLLLPPPQTTSKAAVLNFVGVCANGAATAGVWSSQGLSVPCRIDAAGQYDVTSAMATLEVVEHARAAREGGLSAEILAKLTPAAQESLRRLAKPDNADGKPAPAAAPAELTRLALSDAAPLNARTGYGGVHFDRTAEGGPLLSANGPAAHGLWAHADSIFEFDLGGKWTAFEGGCGLLTSGDGAILATITVDGKAVWESGVIKDGAVKPFNVPVAGAARLTLEIKGHKGKRAAHGAWLEPVLTR